MWLQPHYDCYIVSPSPHPIKKQRNKTKIFGPCLSLQLWSRVKSLSRVINFVLQIHIKDICLRIKQVHRLCHLPYFEAYAMLHKWSTTLALVSPHDTWRSSTLTNILAWVCQHCYGVYAYVTQRSTSLIEVYTNDTSMLNNIVLLHIDM
jgi:hypothetical protein